MANNTPASALKVALTAGKKQRKERLQAEAAADTYGRRQYIAIVADGLSSYQRAVGLLKANVVLVKTVDAALNETKEAFGEDYVDYRKAVDELTDLVTPSITALETIEAELIGEPVEDDNYGSKIPAFDREDESSINNWMLSLTNGIYNALEWTQTAAEVMSIVAQVGEMVAAKQREQQTTEAPAETK